MKRQFVIECSTEYCSVAVYEVFKTITCDDVEYRREVGESIFNEFLGPKFYGKLDSLLFSRERIDNAEPIEMESATKEAL